MEHKNDSIFSETSDYLEGNDISNDWLGVFYEYDINDQLDGSVCHLSEIDEEYIDVFQVSTLIIKVMMIWASSYYLMLISTNTNQVQWRKEW